MRALKLTFTALFAAIAVIAGLVVAAIIALTAFTALLVNRLVGRGRPLPTAARNRAPMRRSAGDAIDVTATEIHSSPAASIEATSLNERFRD